MFNGQKAIEKLKSFIEIYDQTNPTYTWKKYIRDLISAFEAGQDDSVKGETITTKNIWDRMDAIVRCNELCEDRVESRLQAIEERLALLQKQIDVMKNHNHEHQEYERAEYIPLTSKGMSFPYNPGYEPEKPVTDENSLKKGDTSGYENDVTPTKTGECEHEWVTTITPTFGAGCPPQSFKTCKKCYKQESNPTSYIQIPRDIADRFARGLVTPTEMQDVVRKALTTAMKKGNV